MADRSLIGKVAIVTGAGRGLGRAMALGLDRAGVRVVATAAREPDEVEDTAAEGRAALGEDLILPLAADVTLEADARRVVATTLTLGSFLTTLSIMPKKALGSSLEATVTSWPSIPRPFCKSSSLPTKTSTCFTMRAKTSTALSCPPQMSQSFWR